MRNYFSNAENNRLFILWLSNHPESYHSSAVKDEKKWDEESTDDFVETFIDKYFELQRFWEFARKHCK